MRASGSGISSYSIQDSTLLVPCQGSLYTASLPASASPPLTLTAFTGKQLDPKLALSNPNLLAYIRDNNIWLQTGELNSVGSSTTQLTFADSAAGQLAGVAEFAVQEEFDRYTGYWWSPTGACIAYLSVDESAVPNFSIQQPGLTGSVDSSHYPITGGTNAVSDLHVMSGLEPGATPSTVTLGGFPSWVEYVVRVGWTPDGGSVWAQVVDRVQQHTQVLLWPKALTGPPVVLVDEVSDVWINVHDLVHFFKESRTLIWAVENPSGFRHLIHIDYSDTAKVRSTPLTSGEWQVDRDELWVDETRQMVYYVSTQESVLEAHLYSVSYAKPGSPPIRLTPAGQRHAGFAVSSDFKWAFTVGSSIHKDSVGAVYDISSPKAPGVLTAVLANPVQKGPPPFSFEPPTLFTYTNGQHNISHGAYFLPVNYTPGSKVPTLVYVYGGPHVQLVTNSRALTRSARHQLLRHLGFAVVIMDGSGSLRRGLAFEGTLRERMGQIEIQDQVLGVEHLASRVGFVDLDRVGITGWSYGGYLTLMAMAQRADFFKMGIVGAPVSDWRGYDTAYTERYMNTPDANPDGYVKGCVMHYTSGFPDQENRLFVIHGLIDENVHFAHVSVLIQDLIAEKKPYSLQVFPGARHGVSKTEERVYLETYVMRTLLNHLK